MSITDGKLNHSITWWATSRPDGYGGDVVAAPILIKGRWEDRTEKYIGRIDRQEKISNAVVFVDRDVQEGDYLALGDFTANVDPSTLQGAYKVERFDKKSDLRNSDWVRRAVL